MCAGHTWVSVLKEENQGAYLLEVLSNDYIICLYIILYMYCILCNHDTALVY